MLKKNENGTFVSVNKTRVSNTGFSVNDIKTPYLIKKNGMYYADNYSGYTAKPELAGIYTESEAREHCDYDGSGCVAIKASDVIKKEWAQHCIDKLVLIRDSCVIHK